MLIRRGPVVWVLRRHCRGPRWEKTQWALGCRQGWQAASKKSTSTSSRSFLRSSEASSHNLADQNPQRLKRNTLAHEPQQASKRGAGKHNS